MKIPAAPLFVGMFIVCSCPWFVYAFWVVRYMSYRMGKALPNARTFAVFVARRKEREKTPDPEAKRILGQAFRWMKICFATWIIGFVVLVLLLLVLDRVGWLARG